ncbi:MAG TPA: DUF2290 domain-containing protein [Myxococcota bacterium]|nr:DUF2290 domain-containing protein [Myxococcota bacterium]HON24398.1 DUF2290 domain-containing protein [Myxococcota bacterium]HOS61248.1 DUF2290 domain-containing protein [Myxococcota bacterium]HPC91140.1 DUF2290 domain-containing protein [Myxococcota bacterium]HPL24335.1 DUF2290 domain-containing protein [Myxococcota bacterium]
MAKLTAELVGLSLCDQQNYPVLRDLGQGCREVGIGEPGNFSFVLKNVPYGEVYRELERTQDYNLKMLDGALIQVMYRFRDNQIEAHRLAFFPSPFLEEFQNNPEVYLDDEIYAEVIKRNIVPFPLRFDYDCRVGVAVDVDHPKSHLTLGQYKNCRIPVSSPMTPYHFISFILGSFYNTAYRRYSRQISAFTQAFDTSITARERQLVHVQVPESSTR